MDGSTQSTFYYDPEIFLETDATTFDARLVGTAKNIRGVRENLHLGLVRAIAADTSRQRQHLLQRTFLGQAQRREPCSVKRGALDKFYRVVEKTAGNPSKKSLVYLGSGPFSNPSAKQENDWLDKNVPKPGTVIGLGDFCDFLRTLRFNYYIAEGPAYLRPVAPRRYAGRPWGSLEQHGLALVHYTPAGRAWLATADAKYAPWKACTPKAQLLARVLQKHAEGSHKMLLDIIRRYLRIPKTNSQFEMADLLRVVDANLTDTTPATTLLNLFLAHLDAVRHSASP